MPITFMPLQGGHLDVMIPHVSQEHEYEAAKALVRAGAMQGHLGLSAWSGSRCIGAGGVVQIWPGRAEAWGLFGATIGPHIVPVAREIKKVLDGYPTRRLEMTVKVDNVIGHRIAKLLGFGKPECKMQAYHPDGSDMMMYARIERWQQ